MPFGRLQAEREQFLPEGALHVRVKLKLLLDAAVMAAYWVRRGHLQLPTHSCRIAGPGAGTSAAQGESATGAQGDTTVVELVGKVRTEHPGLVAMSLKSQAPVPRRRTQCEENAAAFSNSVHHKETEQ